MLRIDCLAVGEDWLEDERLQAGGQVRGQMKGSILPVQWAYRQVEGDMENVPLRCASRVRSGFLILSLGPFLPKHTMTTVIITKLISLSLAHPYIKERSSLHVSKVGCSSWCSEIWQDLRVWGGRQWGPSYSNKRGSCLQQGLVLVNTRGCCDAAATMVEVIMSFSVQARPHLNRRQRAGHRAERSGWYSERTRSQAMLEGMKMLTCAAVSLSTVSEKDKGKRAVWEVCREKTTSS